MADMLGGEVDLNDVALDQPLPAALIPPLEQVHRRQGRAAIVQAVCAGRAEPARADY